jgi:hypothetical protein
LRDPAGCAPWRKTPGNSILFVGGASFVLGIAAVAGAGQQEAFQLLQSAGLIVYALAYLVMFALPLAGRQRKVLRPPSWLQAASVSGFAMASAAKNVDSALQANVY